LYVPYALTCHLNLPSFPTRRSSDLCDYLKEMRDWGDRFTHVHIKGSVIIDGKRYDDPPAGLDQTDWKTFIAILYAKKYNGGLSRSEEHTSELQSRENLVCRLLLEKK